MGTRIDENEPLLGRYNGDSQSDNRTVRRRSFGKACDRIWAFAQTKTAKMMMKCSLAYLIGSLATLVGWPLWWNCSESLADLLRPLRTCSGIMKANIWYVYRRYMEVRSC